MQIPNRTNDNGRVERPPVYFQATPASRIGHAQRVAPTPAIYGSTIQPAQVFNTLQEALNSDTSSKAATVGEVRIYSGSRIKQKPRAKAVVINAASTPAPRYVDRTAPGARIASVFKLKASPYNSNVITVIPDTVKRNLITKKLLGEPSIKKNMNTLVSGSRLSNPQTKTISNDVRVSVKCQDIVEPIIIPVKTNFCLLKVNKVNTTDKRPFSKVELPKEKSILSKTD